MSVSVVIATLNEADNIASVLNEIPKEIVNEIIVIDGHSVDGTAAIVRKLGYKVIMQEGKGYGQAFSQGIKEAKGDIIVLMDGDGSHNPKDIPLLIEKIREGYDFALGSRYTLTSKSEDDTLIRYLGNKIFTFLTNKIHKMGVSDSLFLFAAFKKEVLNTIKVESTNFEYCVEIIIKAYKAGFKFAEVPSIERKRQGGKSKVNSLYHGLRILGTILKG